MIKCIAIDDEPLALKKLVTYIKKVPYLELVAQCRSAIEAQQVIDNQPVEAIFLDINMPDLNGLDFAKTIKADHIKGPILVFTTAYSEYAIEGYKANGVDYLLKPTASTSSSLRPRRSKKFARYASSRLKPSRYRPIPTTASSTSRATIRSCASASTRSTTSRP